MKVQSSRTPKRPTPPRTTADEGVPIDTTGMTEGQRAALEVAEAAREGAQTQASFAGSMFMGRLDTGQVHPFPQQEEEDRAVGDDLVRQVTTFLAEHLDPEEVDETRSIPKAVVEGLRDLGVFRMKVPVEYGGLGLSQVNYNRVLMAIASHCGSTAVLVSAHQSIGVPQPLKMFGTDAQKEKYLRRIANGALSAFALTETDVGSDPAQMTTTAVRSEDGTHYVLNGSKLWATNGPIAQLLVVMAQTAEKIVRGKARRQITAFVVEADSPGVEVLHRCDFMGLRGIHNGVIRFTNVKVPAENVIWGEGLGLKLALKTLNTGRLTLPAACAGMGKQCLSIVRRWGNDRVQWGMPIGRHEAGAAKIAEIASTAFAMEAVTWLTSHWADEQRDIRIEAAMAKLFCSEACWKLVDQTMQFRGGRGYERAASLRDRGEAPYPVERMLRESRINMIIEGTSEIMRLFLAREALDPHLTLAGDLLRRSAPLGRKLRAAGRLLWFYSRWYPGLVAGRWFTGRQAGLGRLAKHDREARRTSRRLALALFHAMARHQAKLERRQVLLGHLMDIGTELFAMVATCAYARGLDGTGSEDGCPEALADLFCRGARRRIRDHFRAIRSNDQSRANALAKQVLAGSYTWLERGIITCGAANGRGDSAECHEKVDPG